MDRVHHRVAGDQRTRAVNVAGEVCELRSRRHREREDTLAGGGDRHLKTSREPVRVNIDRCHAVECPAELLGHEALQVKVIEKDRARENRLG